MNERAAAPAAGAESLSQHADAIVEIFSPQVAIGIGAAKQLEQCIFGPLPRGDFGGDLLGQHIQGIAGNDEAIQLAAPHRIEQRRALDEIITRERKQSALGRAADRVSRASDALQKRVDRARRSDLADKINATDVKAKLQGCRGHQRF